MNDEGNTASSKKNILLVENDVYSIRLIKKALINYADIEYVTNGKEALELIEKQTFSLVIMDINLGQGLDGIEITSLIRKKPNYKDIPIIATSAFAEAELKQEFINAGGTSYFVKPLDILVFSDMIRKLII